MDLKELKIKNVIESAFLTEVEKLLVPEAMEKMLFQLTKHCDIYTNALDVATMGIIYLTKQGKSLAEATDWIGQACDELEKGSEIADLLYEITKG